MTGKCAELRTFAFNKSTGFASDFFKLIAQK
jgi:hypothetical protein